MSFRLGQFEQLLAQPLVPVAVTDVQEFELKLLLVWADEPIFQHRDADELIFIKEAIEPATLVITCFQQGCVLFSAIRRPAAHVVMLWLKHQGTALKIVDRINHLAAIKMVKMQGGVFGAVATSDALLEGLS